MKNLMISMWSLPGLIVVLLNFFVFADVSAQAPSTAPAPGAIVMSAPAKTPLEEYERICGDATPQFDPSDDKDWTGTLSYKDPTEPSKTKTRKITKKECQALYKRAHPDDAEDPAVKSCKEDYEKLDSEYMKSDSPLRKACTANGTSGLAGCVKAAGTCSRCVGDSQDDDDYAADGCADIDDDDSASRLTGLANGFLSQRNNQGNGDMNEDDARKAKDARVLFPHCPVFAAAELEKIDDEIKSHQDEIQKLEADIESKGEEFSNTKSELERTQGELLGGGSPACKGMTPESPNYLEQCGSLDEKFNQQVAQMTKEYTEKAAQEFEQIGDQLRELAINFKTVDNKLFEEETKIDGECHARALKAISEATELRNRRRGTSTLQAKGGFSGLTNLDSIDNRMEKLALKAKNDCMNKDGQIKRRLAQAREYARLEREKLASIRDRLLRLQEQKMNEVMDVNTNGELQRELGKARASYNKEKKQLESEYKKLAQAYQRLERELSRLTVHLAAKKSALAMFFDKRKSAAAAGVKRKASDSVDPNELTGLAFDFANLHAAAMATCRCGKSKDDAIESTEPNTIGYCRRLKAVLPPSGTFEDFYDEGKSSPTRSRRNNR